MRIHALLAFVVLGCGPATPSPRGAPSNAVGAPAVAQDGDLEAVANRFTTAMMSGDRATMQSLTLTHAQLTALTTKPIERADYDGEVAEFLDGRVREATEATEQEPTSVAAKVVEVKVLEPGEKVKQRLELGIVKLVVTRNGESHDAPMPLFFLKVDGGWRFSLKK